MNIADPNPSKRIFVSHAAVDKELVDLIVDLLSLGIGIDVHNDVFCSSLEGIKIPPGVDFKAFIKDQIQHPKIVILVISQNYLASQFCLAELGASWAMSHRVIPFLVPPITFADMKAVLVNVNGLKINDPSDWNEALAVFREVLSIDPKLNRWEMKRDDAIAKIDEQIPKQALPTTVPLQKLKDAETKLAEANDEIRQLEEDLLKTKQILSEVQKLKDKVEVAKVNMASLSTAQVFKQLVDTAVELMSPLPTVVREALYYHFRAEPLPAPRSGFTDTEDKWDAITSAQERGFLKDVGEGISINTSNPQVHKAEAALTTLSDFVRHDSDMAESFEEENGYQFSFSLRPFWEQYLF